MKQKVILISIDGMRPDGFLACNHPFIHEMMKLGAYTLSGRTVFPSVTLPCHMSMFHSVPPERHGITANVYTPPVRPINGLFEQIKYGGGVSAMYYGWEPLRDVSRPASLKFSQYINAQLDDDMTIPQFYIGKSFTPGQVLSDVSILDLAPTIAHIMGIPAADEWEGKALIQ